MKKYFLKIMLTAAILAAPLLFLQPKAIPFEMREGRANLAVTLRLPKDYEFTKGAPFNLTWESGNSSSVQFENAPAGNFDPFNLPYKIPLRTWSGTSVVTLTARLYFCHKPSNMCFQETFQTRIPIIVTGRGNLILSYTWDIKPRQRETSVTRNVQSAS
ncbi:MAG TPA: hypothetical protein PLL75_03100 [Candidatus Omnitrophota bacterium]|nr:hypothetical protein [Candidatus Omnitrophota bacterium]HPS36699.1 hypothetical protein [Candidatus Omnitrophota bacterium]